MKDLKHEYEQMILPEIPDLWDRIEAALPVEDETPVSAAVTPVSAAAPTPIKPVKKPNIYKWASVAAAFLCAFIAIPMALKDIDGCGGSDSAPMENAADMAMDAAAAEVAMDEAVEDEAIADEMKKDTAPAEKYTDSIMNEEYAEAEEPGNAVDGSYAEKAQSSGKAAFTYEVLAQLIEPLVEKDTIIGYQVLILENADHSYPNGTVEVYFSEDFNMDDLEISEENTKQQYRMHLIYNEEKDRYEMMDVQ